MISALWKLEIYFQNVTINLIVEPYFMKISHLKHEKKKHWTVKKVELVWKYFTFSHWLYPVCHKGNKYTALVVLTVVVNQSVYCFSSIRTTLLDVLMHIKNEAFKCFWKVFTSSFISYLGEREYFGHFEINVWSHSW